MWVTYFVFFLDISSYFHIRQSKVIYPQNMCYSYMLSQYTNHLLSSYTNAAKDVRVIRPLVYTREKQLEEFAYSSKVGVLLMLCLVLLQYMVLMWLVISNICYSCVVVDLIL